MDIPQKPVWCGECGGDMSAYSGMKVKIGMSDKWELIHAFHFQIYSPHPLQKLLLRKFLP